MDEVPIMNMPRYCPACGADTQWEFLLRISMRVCDAVDIDGDDVMVDCSECGYQTESDLTGLRITVEYRPPIHLVPPNKRRT